MNITIIVAIADNNAIGKDNKLLWHISDDLKRFKKITSGHTVIMGKKTYYSLPVRPLPKRTSVVITDVADEKIEGCLMAYSIEEAISLCDPEKENFVIGGGSVYRQFMPHCDKLLITKVHKDFDADTFFPDIDDGEWSLEEKIDGPADSKLPYSFLSYRRK